MTAPRRHHLPPHPGPILAAKDPHAQEAGGSEDAFELLVLAHRLLQDPERAVRCGWLRQAAPGAVQFPCGARAVCAVWLLPTHHLLSAPAPAPAATLA